MGLVKGCDAHLLGDDLDVAYVVLSNDEHRGEVGDDDEHGEKELHEEVPGGILRITRLLDNGALHRTFVAAKVHAPSC